MMAREKWQIGTLAVMERVFKRRIEQEAKYGDANKVLVDGTGPEVRWLGPYTGDSADTIESTLRRDYEDFEDEAGLPTWAHLVREEVAEAFKETDPTLLTNELLDVAALCVAWVEKIEARA